MVELHSVIQHFQRSNTFSVNINIGYPIHCVFLLSDSRANIHYNLLQSAHRTFCLFFSIALHLLHPDFKFLTLSVWLNIVMIRN